MCMLLLLYSRYARLLDEVEERRMRLREEQMNRLSQKENIHKQQRDKRNADIRRRYHEVSSMKSKINNYHIIERKINW